MPENVSRGTENVQVMKDDSMTVKEDLHARNDSLHTLTAHEQDRKRTAQVSTLTSVQNRRFHQDIISALREAYHAHAYT